MHRHIRRRSFDHVEEAARENHPEQHQNSDDDSGTADERSSITNELGSHLVASSDVNVRQRRVILTGLALNAINLLATGNRDFSHPVAERLDTAASQARLCNVPGLRHLATRSVELSRREHLLPHGELDLLSEDIAENSADQHRHENQKQQNEVRQQHALDFADGSETSEERQQADQRRGNDQNVNGSGEQVRAEQLAEEVAVNQRNDSQHENNCAADENDQITDEHSVLDELTAKIHSPSDTHLDDFLLRFNDLGNFLDLIN